MPQERKNQPEVLSVADARTQHPDKWILMRVTELDERESPAKGEIIAVKELREEIPETFKALPKSAKGPYYVFSSFQATPMRTALAMRAMLQTSSEVNQG